MENQEYHLNQLAEDHSAALTVIVNLANEINEKTAEVRRNYNEQLRQAVNQEAKTRTALYNAVADSDPSLWAKTKNRIVGLCKFGWRKKPGRTVIPNAAKTLTAARKHLTPEQQKAVIIVEEKLSKTALAVLPVDTLKKLGVELRADSDEVIVKDAVGEATKMLKHMRDDGWMDDDSVNSVQ